jgi:hypothetical protein
VKDLKNNIALTQSLAPAARTASANGTGVDLQGSESAVVMFSLGALTDGTHTPKVQESDASGSGYTDVAAADLIGSLSALSANTIQQVGYIGNKRYIRAVLTVAGATTGALSSAVVIESNARHHGGQAV